METNGCGRSLSIRGTHVTGHCGNFFFFPLVFCFDSAAQPTFTSPSAQPHFEPELVWCLTPDFLYFHHVVGRDCLAGDQPAVLLI